MTTTSLAPIDESVKIPEAVKRAAAFAEAHYAPANVPAQVQVDPAAPTQVDPARGDQPVNIVATPAPAADTTPRPLLNPDGTHVPAQVQDVSRISDTPPQPDNWEHRYHSMKGRYDQSQQIMGGMQEQMAEMGRELERLSTAVTQQPPRDAARPVRTLTPKDVETYGPELLDVAKRAAIEALAPDINAARAAAEAANARAQRAAEQDVRNVLDREVPDWRALNNDPDFLAWLRLPDVYSNTIRQVLLTRAFTAASAPSVVAFFKGYLAEAQATGQLPATGTQAAQAPTRTPSVPLGTLTAPGRAQPAPGTTTVSPDKPVFTHAQVAEFYSNKGRARYVGRAQDRAADEALIFEAQRDGRIR